MSKNWIRGCIWKDVQEGEERGVVRCSYEKVK